MNSYYLAKSNEKGRWYVTYLGIKLPQEYHRSKKWLDFNGEDNVRYKTKDCSFILKYPKCMDNENTCDKLRKEIQRTRRKAINQYIEKL